MVGGLVEAEQRLGGDEHLGQREAGALAAGKDPHALVDVLASEEEGTEQTALLRDSPGRGNGVDLLQDGISLFKPLELMLSVVRHADVGAERTGTLSRRLLADEHLEERGLAGAIGSDERDTVPAIQRQIGVLVKGLAAEALGKILELDDHIARARRVGELEIDVLVTLGQDHELALDLLDAAHALLGLGGLGRLVTELIDEHLHMGDLALLGGALGAHLLEVVLALLEIGAVIASIGGDTAVLEGRHVIHAGVHKGTVVADDQHGAVVGGDEPAQPLDTFEVEVVGGLVEQQDVGMTEEQLG